MKIERALGDQALFKIAVDHYPHHIIMPSRGQGSWDHLGTMVAWARDYYGDEDALTFDENYFIIDLCVPWIWGTFDPHQHGLIAFQKAEEAVACKMFKG
jgi:hypothetical protein